MVELERGDIEEANEIREIKEIRLCLCLSIYNFSSIPQSPKFLVLQSKSNPFLVSMDLREERER
jgi:hypothetical protein